MDVDISRIQLLTWSLDQHSGDPPLTDKVLRKCDLTRADIQAPVTRCNALKEALFARYACDAVDDVTFAARTGLEFKSTSSLTAYISKHSKDLRQVIANTIQFHWIIDPALTFALRESSNAASLEIDWKDPTFSRYHRRTEFLMFAAIARIRVLTQARFFPIEVRFQHEIGQHAGRYARIGGFPVTFGAERMEIILAPSALDLPVPTYDPSLREHLLQYAERLLAERQSPKQTTRALVEGMITNSLPGTILSADDAANELGLSLRTLSRRLSDEGTSYREIVEDLRCDLAQTFIKNGMTLAEISYSLGYSDQAAFSTAFKRWTGQAPSAFRQRVGAPISSG